VASDTHRSRSRRKVVGSVAGATLVLLGCLQLATSSSAGAGNPVVPSAAVAAADTSIWCAWFGICATTTTTTAPTTTLAPTTTEIPTPGDGPCGGVPTLARTGGGSWMCSFNDEFSGTALDRTKWIPQQTNGSSFSSGGQDCFVDTPNNVAVDDGRLVLTSRKEPAPFTCTAGPGVSYPAQVTSGSVSTYGKFSQTGGRFEARMRVTGAKVTGLHEAFWLWPNDPKKYGAWPASGEIDIAEIYHQYPDRAIPYVHYNNAWDGNVTNNYCMIDDISQFHTYVAEWTTYWIKIIYDGQVCLQDWWSPWWPQSGRQPFDAPFIVALTQGLGQGTNAYNAVTTPLPATTEVDYVRVYK
jgi:beta-glucanase (GH16 family)